MRPLLSLLVLVVSSVVVACSQLGGGERRPVGATNPAFAHLAQRYDRDGDGAITPAEYGRTGRDFSRLDRDADGLVTAADFEAQGRRMRGLAAEDARRLRAVHLLAWYFQGDDDPHTVTAAEALAALRAYDADADGEVGRREFEALAGERARFGRRPGGRWFGLLEVETTDPWERTLLGVDGDDDAFLTADELVAFHRDIAARGEGWTFDPSGAAAERALVGRSAPDFTLQTVDGTAEVTLSDFAGQRPVALVFGSYT